MEVIKLISQVIADFADGEISQASALFNTDLSVQDYLEKSHYKTASLIAASCRSSAVFSGCSDVEKEAMYAMSKSPELVGLVKGRFKGDGDLERALEIVKQEKGIEAAMMLAQGEGLAAKRAIEWLPESDAKSALYMMVDYVLSRLS